MGSSRALVDIKTLDVVELKFDIIFPSILITLTYRKDVTCLTLLFAF